MNCGEHAASEEIGAFTVEYGGKSGDIPDRRMRCGSCGNISYSGDQISEHELAVAAKARELGGLLSAKDLENTRKKYRLTQREMEALLGTGPKTWIRWERGKVVQSKLADTVIRQIASSPRVARDLMVQAGIENADALATMERFDAEERRLLEALFRDLVGNIPGVNLQRLASEAVLAINEANHQCLAEAV
jgi:putative zinc finger/helix-turn-helix YgiT family protein